MGHTRSLALGRLSISVLLVGVSLLALIPGTVQAAGCYNGRCPTGEDDTESKVDVRITITIEPEDAGVVEVDGEELEEDSFQITQGESVTLEADPERGYVFTGWSGSITSTKNPLVTPFYNHKSITAHFAPEEEVEEPSSSALSIGIPTGTAALDADGGSISGVTVDTTGKHDTPDDMVIISDVYDLGPDGATFDPALPLTLPYDKNSLPDGVEASGLVIAWFEEDSKEWVQLPSTVDEDDEVVEALVAHFTDFCVLAPRPAGVAVAPPSGESPGFSFSSLDISPVEPRVGEPVVVTVIASYSGEEAEGATIVTLSVDGATVESRDVIVAAGERRYVEFTYTPATEALHSLNINGLEGSFEVAPSPPSAVLSEAVALAEGDSFELPSVSMPSVPRVSRLPAVGSINLGHDWWRVLLVGLAALTLIVTVPLLRRRIARYRYDI